MVDAVIQWSLRNRLLVLVAAAMLLGWGAVETARMPVDVFPDLTAPTVTVIAEAHGMAPEEVEMLVTFPIEAALNGATGVRRVRSATSVGIAVVWVEFEWGTDIFRARQVVSEKLQLVRGSLPGEIEPPVLAPVSSIMGEIMFLGLTSERQSPMALRTLADWTLRRRLLAVPGVSQVIVIGGDERQFQVLLRPDRLRAWGIAVDEVTAALSAAAESTSAGFYLEGGQEHLIRGVGRVYRAEDIEEAVVALRGGHPVLVRDVAEVRTGPALKRGEGSVNAHSAVVLGIQKQPGVNTIDLTRRIDRELDHLESSLPAGTRIHRDLFRQAEFIAVAVRNVTVALRDGAALVVLVVLLFLASSRATAITVLAMPLSLVAAVLVMRLMGATVNTMTLGGMAIAVGALVDDAIIDVENVVRRLRENTASPPGERRPVLSVVFEASKEIRGSIVFATEVIILVFLPLFFLGGVEGRLLRPLGLAYVVSLASSLVVALTVTPALCSLWLPRSRAVGRASEPRLVLGLKRLYRPVLEAALPRWKTVAAASAAGLAAAGAGLAGAGGVFLPDFNEGTLTISAVTLPGTSLEESDRLGRTVEEILLGEPEVVATARRTGRAEQDEHAQGVHAAEIDVSLRLHERGKQEFLAALRRELALVPGMNIVIGQPISHRIDHMLSGSRASIAVKIFGDDLRELRRIAEQVRAAMEGIEGVVDLAVEQQAEIPLVTIRFDRSEMARQGLTARSLAQAVEAAFGGRTVSRVFEGQAVFDLVVRSGGRAGESFEAIGDIPIMTPRGTWVPLGSLAEVHRDLGPNTISRENGQRKIVVLSNVAGRDLRGVVGDVRRQVARSVALPRGYHIAYGGQFESAEEASRALVLLGGVVVAGIFLILCAAFRSGRDAALVMINLPLALMGGVAGVAVSGNVVSVASIIGFITLFGIATRNGIMMVSHIHYLIDREAVRDPVAAVRRGALERLAPILMTALAAGLGLLPLALARGESGSEIQAPMAIVILFGLVSSTVLNMVVLPALYLRFGTAQRRIRARDPGRARGESGEGLAAGPPVAPPPRSTDGAD